MAREMTPQERAAIKLYEKILSYSPDPEALNAGDDKDFEAIMQALKTARQEALREAASKLGIGDSSGLLDAPCLWCGYNGRGYYQVGTHDRWAQRAPGPARQRWGMR